jgi:hypothetical protein
MADDYTLLTDAHKAKYLTDHILRLEAQQYQDRINAEIAKLGSDPLTVEKFEAKADGYQPVIDRLRELLGELPPLPVNPGPRGSADLARAQRGLGPLALPGR